MSAARRIVGVDAGGSCTVAAASLSDGSELKLFTGEAANASLVGIERAADAIAQAIDGVLDGGSAAAIGIGAAGAGRAATSSALLAALAPRFPGVPIAITDDARIALRGAIPTGDGIVLSAGTGSIAYAELGGMRLRAGGYGYLLGDDGSGYSIGAAALRHLLRAYEERVPHDAMCDALAAHSGASNAAELIERVYGSATPVAEIAACAPLVLQHAARGERSATKIVQNAALELFELVRTIGRADEKGVLSAADVPAAFAGGLLRENSLLTFLLETRIANEYPHLRIVKGGGKPYLGALAEARALL